MNWDKILNWKLLEGSHKFPGPDGGTCINEAAVVAAGFEYRSILTAKDCPPCFSRPLAGYALLINDLLPDDLRQELLAPFVVRLAGTADSSGVEQERMEIIALRFVKEILPKGLRYAGLRELAAECEQATSLTSAWTSLDHRAKRMHILTATAQDMAIYNMVHFANNAIYEILTAADFGDLPADTECMKLQRCNRRYRNYIVAFQGLNRSIRAILDYTQATGVFITMVSILEEAVSIGKQSDPIEIDVVRERMDKIKPKRKMENAS
jgi:hypothetical protein